jgi:hypothetical protein
MQAEAGRGFTQVGKQLFGVDTQRLKLNRVRTTEQALRPKSVQVARA